MNKKTIKAKTHTRLGGSMKCTNKRKLDVHPTSSDIRRWNYLEKRKDILSVLTWQTIRSREFPHLLIIPRKYHAKGHSVLQPFYSSKWKSNRDCVFNDGGTCTIAKTVPDCCMPHNPNERGEVIEKFYNEFKIIHHTKEAISKMIVKAKKLIGPDKLKNILAKDHEYTSSKPEKEKM